MDEEALLRKEEPQKLVPVEGTDDWHVFLRKPLPPKKMSRKMSGTCSLFLPTPA